MHDTKSPYYTTTQAARLLQVSEQTIRNWCESGKLEGAFKLPGGAKALWRIPKDSTSLKPPEKKKTPVCNNPLGITPDMTMSERVACWDRWEGIKA